MINPSTRAQAGPAVGRLRPVAQAAPGLSEPGGGARKGALLPFVVRLCLGGTIMGGAIVAVMALLDAVLSRVPQWQG